MQQPGDGQGGRKATRRGCQFEGGLAYWAGMEPSRLSLVSQIHVILQRYVKLQVRDETNNLKVVRLQYSVSRD